MSEMVERVAKAIDDASLGYSIRLISLIDGVSIYELTDSDRMGAKQFPSYSDALEFITAKILNAKARAAIEAMREPTKEMLSDGELSIGGLPATLAVWEAMIDAALKD